MLGFIKRNCHNIKNVDTLKVIYFSYIRNRLEYCSVLWNGIHQTDVKRIERVQRNFCKFVYRQVGWDVDTQYEIMCNTLNIATLAARRDFDLILFLCVSVS